MEGSNEEDRGDRTLEEVKQALLDVGVEGMTIGGLPGPGIQRGPAAESEARDRSALQPRRRSDFDVVRGRPHGKIGDGKIFIFDVADAIRIRNDERGEMAL
jgi:nitrogen regulatory protein P-II 1